MQQANSDSMQTLLNVLQIVSSILVFIGLIITSLQVHAARRNFRANALLKLIDEWRSPELYAAVNYIHTLRRQWKQSEEDWVILADGWVAEHITANPNSDNPQERQMAEEWMKRRVVSQFISKMGYMMLKGYLKPDDFFGIAPEVRRLLAVLEPIEHSIAKYFRGQESQMADWDQTFDKLEFSSVKDKYDDWFRIHGSNHLARIRNA